MAVEKIKLLYRYTTVLKKLNLDHEWYQTITENRYDREINIMTFHFSFAPALNFHKLYVE